MEDEEEERKEAKNEDHVITLIIESHQIGGRNRLRGRQGKENEKGCVCKSTRDKIVGC